MLTPSLSYDPATDLEIYEGTIEMNKAENKPASVFFVTSVAKRYADIDVKEENIGAKKTQTFRISTGNESL